MGRYYRAPELLMQSPLYTTAVDIWSAGCILGSLLLRAPLFLGLVSVFGTCNGNVKDNVQTLNSIFYFLGTPSKKDWPVGFEGRMDDV